ncbi:hypothetical protein AgCh_023822 [Apium graveolens]
MMEAGKIKNRMINLSYPMLSRANYITWAIKMKAIPEDILLTLADKETAKEAWEAIKVTAHQDFANCLYHRAIWQPRYYDIGRDGGVVEGSRRASKGIDRHRRKPNHDKDVKEEAHMAQNPDEEPALLLAELKQNGKKVFVINEEQVKLKLSQGDVGSQMESNMWYLDNGASNHMIGQLSKFDKLDKSVVGHVKFGDGSVVQIEGKGCISLKFKNGKIRILDEVYFIPSLRSNIISLGHFAEEGYNITIRGDYLWVREQEGNFHMKVKCSTNRLYKIKIYSRDLQCLMSRCEDESWLWHSRLGHVNFKAIKLMAMDNMVLGMHVIKQLKEVCTDCLMSKQCRKYFPSQSKSIATRPLELMHGDSCGPISPTMPVGNKYIFVLIDDYSRVMWTYLLKNKNDALDAFKKFCVLVENSPGKKIGTFRTNNGGEFTSKDFARYFEEARITRHFSAPYSSQLNGMVERRNRTLIEMSRSLLKEMKMSNYLWGEAV